MSDYLQSPNVPVYSDEYFKSSSSDELLPRPSIINEILRINRIQNLILQLVLFGNMLAQYLAEISVPSIRECLTTKKSQHPNISPELTNQKTSSGAGAFTVQFVCPNDLLKTAVTFLIVVNVLAQLQCCAASSNFDPKCNPKPPNCFSCGDTQYYHDSRLSACEVCLQCPPGLQPDKPCAPNARCVPCGGNHFSDKNDQETCFPCRKCDNTINDTPCTSTSDRKCGPCAPGFGLLGTYRKDQCHPCDLLGSMGTSQESCKQTPTTATNTTPDLRTTATVSSTTKTTPSMTPFGIIATTPKDKGTTPSEEKITTYSEDTMIIPEQNTMTTPLSTMPSQDRTTTSSADRATPSFVKMRLTSSSNTVGRTQNNPPGSTTAQSSFISPKATLQTGSSNVKSTTIPSSVDSKKTAGDRETFQEDRLYTRPGMDKSKDQYPDGKYHLGGRTFSEETTKVLIIIGIVAIFLVVISIVVCKMYQSGQTRFNSSNGNRIQDDWGSSSSSSHIVQRPTIGSHSMHNVDAEKQMKSTVYNNSIYQGIPQNSTNPNSGNLEQSFLSPASTQCPSLEPFCSSESSIRSKAKCRRGNENTGKLNASDSSTRLLDESPQSVRKQVAPLSTSPNPLLSTGGHLGNNDSESVTVSEINLICNRNPEEENGPKEGYRSLNSQDMPPRNYQTSTSNLGPRISCAVDDKCQMPPSKKEELSSQDAGQVYTAEEGSMSANQNGTRHPVQETQLDMTLNPILMSTRHQTAKVVSDSTTWNYAVQHRAPESFLGNDINPIVRHPESQFSSFQPHLNGRSNAFNHPSKLQAPLAKSIASINCVNSQSSSPSIAAATNNVFNHQDNHANARFNLTQKAVGSNQALAPQIPAISGNAIPQAAPQTNVNMCRDRGVSGPDKLKTGTGLSNRRSSIGIGLAPLQPLQTHLVRHSTDMRSLSSPPLFASSSPRGPQNQNPFWQYPITSSSESLAFLTTPNLTGVHTGTNGNTAIYGPETQQPRYTEVGTSTTPQPSPGGEIRRPDRWYSV